MVGEELGKIVWVSDGSVRLANELGPAGSLGLRNPSRAEAGRSLHLVDDKCGRCGPNSVWEGADACFMTTKCSPERASKCRFGECSVR